MNPLKSLFKHEAATPLLALAFASGVGVTLVAARVVITHNLHYTLLVWNIFLAWLPLIFALGARKPFQAGQAGTWKFFSLAAAWLLFFPNAPYIFTDLIHVQSNYRLYWVDLLLVLVCALTGLVLGFVSLYLMQSMVARRFGAMASWLFVAATVGLSSLGIFLGRFLRLNSWDVVLHPGKMYHRLDHWSDDPWLSGHTVSFLSMFAIFLFLAYIMLYALTHLPRVELQPAPPNRVVGPETI
jgi:uncharacterized membrane protein